MSKSQIYKPNEIEEKVQNYWEKNRCFEVAPDPKKEKLVPESQINDFLNKFPEGKIEFG